MKIFAKSLMVLVVMVGASSVYMAQDKLRSVVQPAPYQYPKMPVKVDVKFDDREMVERKTVAGPDWLHKLSIDVTNTSGKSIKALRIDLILRESQTSPGIKGVSILLMLYNSQPKTTMLLPGDRTTLVPAASHIDRFLGLLKEEGTPDVEKVILDVRDFEFTDGTRWLMGSLMRLDPESGHLKKVQESAKYYDGPPRSLFLTEEWSDFFLG